MNPAISVENVSMMFNLNTDRILGLKEYVVAALRGRLNYEEFWALKNISFEVQPGEVLGILGLNGSGKSTLLKLIAGVFKPTKGRVRAKGEIAPLLELGTGFDIEFSAKDNVYMNGAMFGRSPSYMNGIYNEIMDFAELWDFEHVPVKNFSSGMIARLGFAVATTVEPDILILDEILGVGDYQFAKKCEKRISELLSKDLTVLIVSHVADTIRELCSKALLLRKGEMICIGDVDDVCYAYSQGDTNE